MPFPINKHLLYDVDASWTLFLDRDGVINERLYGDYIKVPDEFHFLPGVLEAFYHLEDKFAYQIVVTNQQGIGKGLMSHEQLSEIHAKMIHAIEASGGHIDEVYYCSDLDGFDSYFRKPNPGMALQAQSEYPLIDFKKSIMVGDSPSDMEFGKKLGMVTVLVSEIYVQTNPNTDMVLKSLKEFSLLLQHKDNNYSEDKFISRQ